MVNLLLVNENIKLIVWSSCLKLVNDRQILYEKVQAGKNQENAQSEKDSHSKNQGGKNTN